MFFVCVGRSEHLKQIFFIVGLMDSVLSFSQGTFYMKMELCIFVSLRIVLKSFTCRVFPRMFIVVVNFTIFCYYRATRLSGDIVTGLFVCVLQPIDS